MEVLKSGFSVNPATNPEKLAKLKSLQDILYEKNYELEVTRENLNRTFDSISDYQIHNSSLRSYIQSFEEKREDFEKNENPVDPYNLIINHLDALSITAHVQKVTENIYKIDEESIHLFIKNGELMTQNNSKNITFVE